MMSRIFIVIVFILVTSFVYGQDKYFTKSGKINFYSNAPLEDITAINTSAVAVLDTKSGSLQFSILIKGFEFENEEMQEHFNDHYMESDKYPKAEFKGQILNTSSINFKKNGSYAVQVKGLFTLHGVTKDIQTSGTILVDDTTLKASSSFNIQVADYNIIIPKLVRDKVAKTVKIVIHATLQPIKA
jgi:polyisoprenoid-binding protein YceI